MNILNIQECADFFRKYYLKTFYLVTTYNGKSFILVGEKGNFPHLMGIQKNTYRSNGYNKPQFSYIPFILSNNGYSTILYVFSPLLLAIST